MYNKRKMFTFPVITFNLLLFGLAGLLAFLGFMFGENRLKIISYASFIAFFVLLAIPDSFFKMVTEKVNFQLGAPKIIFVAIVCVVFYLGALVNQKKAFFKVRAIPLGILTALFIAGFCIQTLSVSENNKLLTDYNLAVMVYNFRILIMFILAIWLAVVQFLPQKDKDDKK